MKFESELFGGNLIRRYMRFLADVKLDEGEVVKAHCTNTGSMKSCIEAGAKVYLSKSNNPERKTQFTWEMIEINGRWVGINTNNPNNLAFEWVSGGLIPELAGYKEFKREFTWLDCRFDLMCRNDHETVLIEVKNVTYKEGNYALFPDAQTSRGLKHLNTLVEAKRMGFRVVMLYVIQRTDCQKFGIAKEIDPEYYTGFKNAINNGVEILPYTAEVSPAEIVLGKKLQLEI